MKLNKKQNKLRAFCGCGLQKKQQKKTITKKQKKDNALYFA